MGIIFTKYEDSDNNNVVFDSSKFDHFYDSDTFDTDVATDFDTIILDHGDVFHIVKQTTTEDGMGTISAVSETDYRIYGMLFDISKRDREVHEMGLAVPGNRILYIKPVYTITSGGVDSTHEVVEGDILKDRNNEKWRVVKVVHEPYIQDTKIYKKCIVQNIGLAGSS